MSDTLDLWMTAASAEDDQEAFARVVERCHHVIRAMLLRETADSELADEIAQEALCRAWTHRQQYRPGTSPRAWLLSIARSQLVDHQRRATRGQKHLRELIRQHLLRYRDEDVERENSEERVLALRECLANLGQEQRRLIDLVHAQGLTSEGAAEVIGIKPPACRQRLSRLQRALRGCVEKRLQAN
ncbi:ECF RNA polymerase sigma factor SigL [Planctomycetes bacterium Pan216]|uniref:ECF RNA polymerase sigma factor SigL n=1 Tax=Kolteria novifilia TaxID=2527975 RepID=A0A518AZF9_9BACT|nr:ECF RNA polymerase sigma factor SigL [Planctomycetes bacterium Pan216]